MQAALQALVRSTWTAGRPKAGRHAGGDAIEDAGWCAPIAWRSRRPLAERAQDLGDRARAAALAAREAAQGIEEIILAAEPAAIAAGERAERVAALGPAAPEASATGPHPVGEGAQAGNSRSIGQDSSVARGRGGNLRRRSRSRVAAVQRHARLGEELHREQALDAPRGGARLPANSGTAISAHRRPARPAPLTLACERARRLAAPREGSSARSAAMPSTPAAQSTAAQSRGVTALRAKATSAAGSTVASRRRGGGPGAVSVEPERGRGGISGRLEQRSGISSSAGRQARCAGGGGPSPRGPLDHRRAAAAAKHGRHAGEHQLVVGVVTPGGDRGVEALDRAPSARSDRSR